MSAVAADRPQFATLERALRFAFYEWHFVSGTVEEPSFARFITKNHREQIDEPKPRRVFGPDIDRTPEGYDAAGQAGLIQAFIEALPEPERSHIKAKFLLEQQRADAKQRLVQAVLPTLGTGAYRRRLLLDLISRFYGKRGEEMTFKSMQKRYAIGRYELATLNRRVTITLDVIAHRAETRVYSALQEQGVIA